MRVSGAGASPPRSVRAGARGVAPAWDGGRRAGGRPCQSGRRTHWGRRRRCRRGRCPPSATRPRAVDRLAGGGARRQPWPPLAMGAYACAPHRSDRNSVCVGGRPPPLWLWGRPRRHVWRLRVVGRPPIGHTLAEAGARCRHPPGGPGGAAPIGGRSGGCGGGGQRRHGRHVPADAVGGDAWWHGQCALTVWVASGTLTLGGVPRAAMRGAGPSAGCRRLSADGPLHRQAPSHPPSHPPTLGVCRRPRVCGHLTPHRRLYRPHLRARPFPLRLLAPLRFDVARALCGAQGARGAWSRRSRASLPPFLPFPSSAYTRPRRPPPTVGGPWSPRCRRRQGGPMGRTWRWQRRQHTPLLVACAVGDGPCGAAARGAETTRTAAPH